MSEAEKTGRRLRGWVARATALMSFAFVLACGSGIPIRFYTLDREPSEAPPAATTLRVGVASVVVEPPYDQDRIAYRPPGTRHEIAFYHYHRWAVPPAVAWKRGLVAALDRVEGIEARTSDEGWSGDVELSVRILRLEEVDDTEESVRVVVALEVTIVGSSGEPRQPLELELEAPAQARTVEAVVEAFGVALDEAARRIAAEL